jgi:hypothetical protein
LCVRYTNFGSLHALMHSSCLSISGLCLACHHHFITSQRPSFFAWNSACEAAISAPNVIYSHCIQTLPPTLFYFPTCHLFSSTTLIAYKHCHIYFTTFLGPCISIGHPLCASLFASKARFIPLEHHNLCICTFAFANYHLHLNL